MQVPPLLCAARTVAPITHAMPPTTRRQPTVRHYDKSKLYRGAPANTARFHTARQNACITHHHPPILHRRPLSTRRDGLAAASDLHLRGRQVALELSKPKCTRITIRAPCAAVG